MIRRRALQIIAVPIAALTVIGCQDAVTPTAPGLTSREVPRPSFDLASASTDVTYPILHGTLRIYDVKIESVSAGTIFNAVTAQVTPGTAVRITGKWAIGPITNVDECQLCSYSTYMAWGNTSLDSDARSVNHFVTMTSPQLDPNAGPSGTFDWTTYAPHVLDVTFYVVPRWSVGDEEHGTGFGWLTGYGPGTSPPVSSLKLMVLGASIAPTVSGTLGTNGWYTSDVGVSWDVQSGGPTPSLSGCDPVSISSDVAGMTLKCSATTYRGTSVRAVTINRDATKPTLAPVISPNPVAWKGAATALPNASDGGSGIAAQSCGAVSTAAVGTFSVDCTATDKAGNTSIASVSYVVTGGYTFGGFASPIDPLPVWNTAKAGSAIPVKFSLGGNYGLDIFAVGYPKLQPTACPASPTDNPVEEAPAAAAGSGLTYDAASNQYTYVWKSAKGWAGTCGDLVMKLADGHEYSARFQFKK